MLTLQELLQPLPNIPMPRCSNNLTTFLILASASVSLACGGSDVAAPTTGTIAVTVTSTGADIDPDGYQLSVDGGAPRDILANGTAKWTGSPGVHTLALSGLAFNCDITAAPTSADVALGQTTAVNIQISCPTYLHDAIVFTSEQYGLPEVMVMRTDGTRRQRLTTDQVAYAGPVIAPDGQSITVAARIGGGWNGIYRLDRFGKSRSTLISRGAQDGDPVWSPDGTRLAFGSQLPGPYGEYGRIWIVNRDGSGLRQLTPETDTYTYDAGSTWSPDGMQLIYGHNGELWKINADGSSPVSLGITGQYPNWSPDGSQVVYHTWAGNDLSIFVATAEGGNVRQLTSGAQDQFARWSPDGNQILFQRVEGGKFQLYRMAPDGTGLTKLSTVSASESSASWSPIR